MAKRILIRRDTTANWESVNPILSNGEFGIEIKDDGTRSLKLGTGSVPWDSLDYFLNDPATAADLNNEISNRENADLNLQDTIDDLGTDLSTETTNRTNADTNLQDSIDNLETDLATETTNRINGDSNLQGNIDTVSTNLATETTNRTNADSDLQDSIDSLETDLGTETTNRENADSGLQDGIDTLETDLATEISDRQTAVSTAISTAATDATNKANTAESNAKEYADDLALATQKWLPAVQTLDDLPANPGDGTYLCRVITGDDYGVYQWIGTETDPEWTYFSDNLDFIDRIANPVTDNIPIITSNGELIDSGESITGIYNTVSTDLATETTDRTNADSDLQSQIDDLETGLAAKEDAIAAGTTSQYYRGDKTWQNLPSSSTVNDGVLTLQKNGINIDTFTANASADKTINIIIAKSDIGLSNVDNTADADKPLSEAMTTALNNKEPLKYIAADETEAASYSALNPDVMVFYPEE
jgi:uncharacterized protein YceH (UPF0502 family)